MEDRDRQRAGTRCPCDVGLTTERGSMVLAVVVLDSLTCCGSRTSSDLPGGLYLRDCPPRPDVCRGRGLLRSTFREGSPWLR